MSNRSLGDQVGADFNTLAVANLPPSVGGQGTPLNNLQPSLSLNYLVAARGVLSSQIVDSGAVGPA